MSAVLKAVEKREEVVSYNPATGEILGTVPQMSAEEVGEAVRKARSAQIAWKKTSFKERGQLMMRVREIILQEMDAIADLVSEEMGKPKIEVFTSEIVATCDLARYFAQNTAKILKPEKIDLGLWNLQGRTSKIIYQPLGVIGIISPWNYPWAIPFGEVVMSLMAGNSVVLKPSELTPLTGLKIGEIFAKAELPADLLHIVTGDGRTGAALVESGVNKIMFTGSVATGKKIAASAAQNLTPVVLELGGKDPMIILEDADLETAARGAVWGAFTNSGQACASVERCYVHESIAEKFTARVVALTNEISQNIGLREDAEISSMSSEAQLKIVEDHVTSFREDGASILTGGNRNRNFNGAFFEPTVISNADNKMRAMREETFGPTLPIATFKTDDEAVKLANDSEFGLCASVWTKNLSRGNKIAEKIEAGTITINEVLYTHSLAATPWGGVKNSGYGRTHGKQGLLELVTPQHIHVNKITFLNDLWWFNYSAKATEVFRNFAREFTTGSKVRTMKLVPQILQRLKEIKTKKTD